MKQRRYSEHNESGVKFAVSFFGDGSVNVSDGPHVHWHIPSAPEYGYIVGVPPIRVELSVCELQQLTHQVQERVEAQVEKAQPYEMVRYLEM